jgi:hypothetical protein
MIPNKRHKRDLNFSKILKKLGLAMEKTMIQLLLKLKRELKKSRRLRNASIFKMPLMILPRDRKFSIQLEKASWVSTTRLNTMLRLCPSPFLMTRRN